MLINKEVEYTVLGLMFLAKQETSKYFDISTIATENNISVSILRKLFQRLVAANILESKLGPGGGVRIYKDLKDIHLLELIQIVHSTDIIKCGEECLPYCPDVNCPLKNVAKEIRGVVEGSLYNVTLLDILNRENI